MPPLISVMIPCYNAVKTLPLAIASLIAQTYPHWECIVIDDGSVDRPADLLGVINDPRIRYIRFEQNRGRGIARQYALDIARGDYLCMLDADDWLYPNKLQRQLQVMMDVPEIAILSTGMAIVDQQNGIIGVRTNGINQNNLDIFPKFKEPKHPSIAYAPSMIRMDVAKQTKYDPAFRFSEDSDFLLKILLQYSYGALWEITYVYTEVESVTPSKIINSLSYNRLIFSKYQKEYRRAVYARQITLLLKELYYRVGFALGLGAQLITRRSQKPTPEMVREFYKARYSVLQMEKSLFQTN